MEQHPKGRSSLKGDMQVLNLTGEHQTAHTCVSDLHRKLLNLLELWPDSCAALMRAGPETAAEALGPSPSAPRPRTPRQQGPPSSWEGRGFPSPAAERSPHMGLVIHSSSTVQGWSSRAALTHEQTVATQLLLTEAEKSLQGLCSLTSHSQHGPSACSDQYLNDGDSIKRPFPMH